MSALTLVSTEATVVDPKDLTPRKLWELEIEAATRAMDKFIKRAVIAVDRFTDERDAINTDQKWFNIYYANTNIMESALYADLPNPSVCRRYEDYQDQVARVAALILQRSLKQDINDPEDTFHGTMKQSVQDRLIAGMACAWLRFETETESVPTTKGGSITNNAQSTQPHASLDGKHDDGFQIDALEGEQPLMKIVDQSVIVDYVHWKDFLFSPCRTWGERRWVARRVFMTREQLTKRFGKAKADLTSLDFNILKDNEGSSNQNELLAKDVFQKAVVWEIWDRTTRKVHWYAPGYPKDLLDTRDDFLHLQSFEPCPKPMLANITTSSTVPRPDYYMIQDQYSELNTVNARISLLIQACKVVGIYDQNAVTALQGLFTGNENTMIPVPNWAQFSEKGGIKGSVDWIPLEVVVVALEKLYQSRDLIKGQIYELTGIADIVRGDSKASETLGAQQIKAKFAGIRIRKLQDEVAEFASDILRIKGEMQAKLYEPATLIRKSGIFYTDNHEWVVDAILLLKSEKGFNWRIEVEADSMAQADYETEREDRIKFLSMVTGYLANALPMAGQIPELKPVILGMLKWVIASFKGASDIEGMIDKQLSQMEGKPPPPPKPDPKEMAAQAKMQALQMKGQQDAQKAQADMAMKQQEAQLKMQEMEQKLAMQREEMAMEREEHQQEMEFRREEMAMDAQEQQQNLEATMQEHEMTMQTNQQLAQQKVHDSMVQSDIQREKGEQEIQLAREQGSQQLAQGAQAHQQTMQQQKAAGQQKLQQDKAAGQQALVLKKASAKANPKKGK